VVEDPVAGKVLCGRGEYGWGGAFSTAFWVAPAEDLVVLFFTQLLPSSTHPIRTQLKQLVYQALLD
jgi:CubicO group peptidase (beta-lactamase class C family)